jgi:uncharacterized protein
VPALRPRATPGQFRHASEHHHSCRDWLERALNGAEQVGLAWQVVLAFIRIGTNPRVFTRPLSPSEAIGVVEEWLERPQVVLLHPFGQAWALFKEQVRAGQASGPLIMDAALAALALEHGGRLCTTDRDFTRFAGLELVDPRTA